MQDVAKLITAIAALLGAIAWPLATFALGWSFRREIRAAANKLPSLIDRMRKMKLAGIEAELDHVAQSIPDDGSGKITLLEVEAATRVAQDANDYDVDLARQLDRLCLEYDALRRTMPPGDERTNAMTRILARMRVLAPSLVGAINSYKTSASPGSRLAAIAMMQMNPNACEIEWLSQRFEVEQPFLFYHAALALQNLANNAMMSEEWDQLLGAAQRSLDTVNSFKGTPDGATIEVLKTLISSIRQ